MGHDLPPRQNGGSTATVNECYIYRILFVIPSILGLKKLNKCIPELAKSINKEQLLGQWKHYKTDYIKNG